MERDPNQPDGRMPVLLSLLVMCVAIFFIGIQVYAIIYGG